MPRETAVFPQVIQPIQRFVVPDQSPPVVALHSLAAALTALAMATDAETREGVLLAAVAVGLEVK